MIHYDNIIKAEKMKYYNDYETLLFARAKGKIKSVTGVLPLTFTAKGGSVDDWVIEGNDEPGENKMPAPANGAYTANRATVTVTDGVYHVVQVAGSGSSSVFIDIPEFKIPESGYVNLLNNAIVGGGSIIFRYNRTSLNDGFLLSPTNKNVAINSELAGKVVNQIWVYLSAAVSEVDFTFAPMITDNNTYSTYIPYQQGVGERTENLFGASTATAFSISTVNFSLIGSELSISSTGTNDGISSVSSQFKTNLSISLVAGTYSYKCDKSGTTSVAKITIYDKSNNTTIATNQSSDTFTLTSDKDIFFGLYIPANATINDVIKITLVKSTTAPQTYIPFGYQVPITITDESSNTIERTFYIGNSPLTAGQSISKTSTGVDIELFEGENTIDTSLYNKPEMKINYK